MRKEMRKIVVIDEDKCNGCGLCIPSCAEGAMQIVNGKAKLIADKLCDGLGACLGSCPQDALHVIDKEVDAFDEAAVEEHLKTFDPVAHGAPAQAAKPAAHSGHGHSRPAGQGHGGGHGHGGGCPGSRAISLANRNSEAANGAAVNAGDVAISIKPQLGQWPVQIKLVPENAPYFAGAHLLVAADCVPVAYPDFQLDLLKGKAVAIGCPKLDDLQFYVEKLARIIQANDLEAITVAYMEVPCCTGMVMAVEQAVSRSGKDVPVHKVKIGVGGGKVIS